MVCTATVATLMATLGLALALLGLLPGLMAPDCPGLPWIAPDYANTVAINWIVAFNFR